MIDKVEIEEIRELISHWWREGDTPSIVAARKLLRAHDDLLVRQEEHLALIAKLSRETPYPEELDECRRQRAALVAEVGTLRARDAFYELGDAVYDECKKQRDAFLVEVARLRKALEVAQDEVRTLRRQW